MAAVSARGSRSCVGIGATGRRILRHCAGPSGRSRLVGHEVADRGRGAQHRDAAVAILLGPPARGLRRPGVRRGDVTADHRSRHDRDGVEGCKCCECRRDIRAMDIRGTGHIPLRVQGDLVGSRGNRRDREVQEIAVNGRIADFGRADPHAADELRFQLLPSLQVAAPSAPCLSAALRAGSSRVAIHLSNSSICWSTSSSCLSMPSISVCTTFVSACAHTLRSGSAVVDRTNRNVRSLAPGFSSRSR